MNSALGKITLTGYLAEKKVESHAYNYNMVTEEHPAEITELAVSANEIQQQWCQFPGKAGKMDNVLTIFVFQESKWSFFKRKMKQNTNFENPIYAEVLLNVV